MLGTIRRMEQPQAPLRATGKQPRREALAVAVRGTLVAGLLLSLLAAHPSAASDWPQILGPNRNGVAPHERLAEKWPASGPTVLWNRKVGQGLAGVAIARGRLILFHRVGNEEVAEALEPDTGKQLWAAHFSTEYASSISSDSGPRCVPVIHQDHVFLLGAEGRLSCVSFADGDVQWSRDVRQEYNAPEGYFGVGSTPIVEGDKLLVNVGGRDNAGIVAFSLRTGQTMWKATQEAASYSSPVATTIDGVRHVIFATRLNVLSIDPAGGQLRFRFPFGQRGPTVNAANPVVIDRHLFLSASYGVGAALLRVREGSADVVWRDRQDLMSSHYMTSVYHDGVLYGVDGRADLGTCRLRAFDPLSGTIHWTEEDFGMATIVVADDKLVIMKCDGELLLARPTVAGYRPLARARLFNNTVRALPAIADGKLYAPRHADPQVF